MNVRAYTNSWLTRVKEKITTVRMPETEIGMTSFRNVWKRVRPSTIAASSSSPGMDLKNPMRSHVEKGIVKLG